MSVFGIIVEGQRDAAVYSTIIRRIRPDINVLHPRPCGGLPKLRQRFVGFLREFSWLHVDKALVIRDSDCVNSRACEEKLNQVLGASGFQPTFPVHFYATRCMVETWLLADEGAVTEVARSRGRSRSVKPINKQLEGVLDPKPLFSKMLSAARLPSDPAVYREIAALADIDRIRERCPYFGDFIARVHAC